jgi:hypothetical protein
VNQRLPDWFPDWSNEVCIIVASGPSAKDHQFEDYRGRAKFIVVNNSWKLVPWADVLIGADGGWWQRYKGVPGFTGIKVTLDVSVSRQFDLELIKLVKHVQSLSTDKPGVVGMGGNSGFYALNLAVQFGCKKIILVGFDMHLKNGMHWHGPHEKGLNNPIQHRIQKWRAALDNEASNLRRMGVEVINASETSALTAYPKMTVHEALKIRE